MGAMLCVLAMPLLAADEAEVEEPVVPCTFTPMPREYRIVSSFDALVAGKDGMMYMGTSRYGSPGSLIRYDPQTCKIVQLTDVSAPASEDLQRVVPSGKIHSQLNVASDGRIYYGSHLGDHRCMTGESPFPYGGGHFFCYDPATGTTEDLGVPCWPESVMRCDLDERRMRLYGMTYPSAHLITKDLKTGALADKGQVSHSGYAMPLTMADGMVYFLDGRGHVVRYNPDGDTIDNVLDIPPLPSGTPAVPNHVHMRELTPDRTEIWDTMPAEGRPTPERWLFRFRCKHGLLRRCSFDYVAQVPVEAANPIITPQGRLYLYKSDNKKARLFYYDKKRKETLFLGVVTDRDKGVVMMYWPGTSGPDGSLYFGGGVKIEDQRFEGSSYGYGVFGFVHVTPDVLDAAIEEAR